MNTYGNADVIADPDEAATLVSDVTGCTAVFTWRTMVFTRLTITVAADNA